MYADSNVPCISHIPKCYYGSCWYESYRRKEGNVLFNDALNTFYLRLYGVRHMVKDHAPTTDYTSRCLPQENMYITRLIHGTIEYTWDDVIAFRRDRKITASTDVACAHEPCRHIVQTTSDLFSGRQISFFSATFVLKHYYRLRLAVRGCCFFCFVVLLGFFGFCFLLFFFNEEKKSGY